MTVLALGGLPGDVSTSDREPSVAEVRAGENALAVRNRLEHLEAIQRLAETQPAALSYQLAGLNATYLGDPVEAGRGARRASETSVSVHLISHGDVNGHRKFLGDLVEEKIFRPLRECRALFLARDASYVKLLRLRQQLRDAIASAESIRRRIAQSHADARAAIAAASLAATVGDVLSQALLTRDLCGLCNQTRLDNLLPLPPEETAAEAETRIQRAYKDQFSLPA